MYKTGRGLIDSAINSLPFELHLPGYQYCGPGTKLEKRLARGDSGVNPLDAACREHDIVYSKYRDGEERTEADKILSTAALKRAFSKDAGVGERSAALLVSGVMKAKVGLSKLGKGLKKRMKGRPKKTKNAKKCAFKTLVSKTKKAMKVGKPKTADDIVHSALAAAHRINKNKNISQPRIIPIPKSGGVLPLVPIFAGLSALGSLAGGASAIYNAIKSTKNGKNALNGGKGAVAVGKSVRGSGLYLRPYKKGYGLYLQPYQLNSKNY